MILLFITRYMGPVGPWQRPCRRPLVAQRRAFLINLLLPRTSLRSHSGVSHGSFSPSPPTEEEVSGEVPRQCLVYQRRLGPVPHHLINLGRLMFFAMQGRTLREEQAMGRDFDCCDGPAMPVEIQR